MKETTLLKISLIGSILGVIILYVLSLSTTLPEKEIGSITYKDIGKDVKVKGLVKRITPLEGVTFIEVEQPSTVTIVLFNSERLNLTQGNYVEVIGEIDEYKGELEVIGQRVRVIG